MEEARWSSGLDGEAPGGREVGWGRPALSFCSPGWPGPQHLCPFVEGKLIKVCPKGMF